MGCRHQIWLECLVEYIYNYGNYEDLNGIRSLGYKFEQIYTVITDLVSTSITTTQPSCTLYIALGWRVHSPSSKYIISLQWFSRRTRLTYAATIAIIYQRILKESWLCTRKYIRLQCTVCKIFREVHTLTPHLK